MNIRCRHRIPSPEAVGFLTKEELREAAAQYPHLRPLQETRLELAVSDGLREVCRQT